MVQCWVNIPKNLENTCIIPRGPLRSNPVLSELQTPTSFMLPKSWVFLVYLASSLPASSYFSCPTTTYCIFILLTSRFPRNTKVLAFIWSMTEEKRLVEEGGTSSKKTWWQKKEDAAERVSSSSGPLPASSRLHLPPEDLEHRPCLHQVMSSSFLCPYLLYFSLEHEDSSSWQQHSGGFTPGTPVSTQPITDFCLNKDIRMCSFGHALK